MSITQYRWNARQAAADYDAAAPFIHPLYEEVQQAVLSALPYGGEDSFHEVDLGAGSGRLAERVLTKYPKSSVTLVDQSEAFLGVAGRRLQRFTDRVQIVPQAVQQLSWQAVERPDVIVSTSALHHLVPAEKNALFRGCRQALPGGTLFINGDEYRPPSDVTYRNYLQEWGEHMRSALAAGLVPETFGEMIDRWEERNLGDFGGQRASGDDCHETIEEQIARLYGAGFKQVRSTWSERLWAVLVAAT